jgi:transposase InsO family protein
MKQWWTLAELAARRLPGLPETRQGLADRADSAGWRTTTQANGTPAARQRSGRGGGTEYHISVLPAEARIALDEAAQPPAVATEITVSIPAAACATTVGVRDARLTILVAADRLRAAEALSQGDADRAFVALYANRTAGLDDWVYEAVRSVSVASLYRWRQAAKAGSDKLASGHGGARRAKVVELANGGAVAVRVQRMIAEQPFLTAKDLRKGIKATFGDMLDVDGENVPLPSTSAFSRYASEWKATNKAVLTKLTDPDGYRSRYRISGGTRHGHVERLNQTWQIDASPADVMCTDGRHSLYFCIDIWSRRVIAYVTRTPRAAAVGLLLRKAILAWGLPEEIETDNGSDFRAQDTQRFLAAVGIKVDYCDAYSPWQKGHVERVIGTIQRSFGVWQPGFIGHSVADRKRIEARKSLAQRRGETADDILNVELTAAELQRRLDGHIEHGYAHDEHSGLGTSPYAKAASYAGTVRRVADDRALDVLLYKVADGSGIRTVGKEGIRVDGGLFICTTLMPGEKVLVRMDPADLGRAHCFSVDGAQYLGEAVNPERAGLDPVEVKARWDAEYKRRMASGTAAIKRDMRDLKLTDIGQMIARGQAEAAGKLVAFPKRSETHETPAIAAAAEALRDKPLHETKLSEAEQKLHAELVAEMSGEATGGRREVSGDANKNVIALPESPKQRFRRALDLERRSAAGDQIGDDAARWLGAYQTTPEYRSHASMLEDFGEAWLAAGN